MAHTERDVAEAHEWHATQIMNFLYETKKQKEFKEHTEDEYRQVLKEIMESCYEQYHIFAKAYGWE